MGSGWFDSKRRGIEVSIEIAGTKGLLQALSIDSAGADEPARLQQTVRLADAGVLPKRPIEDKGYDSDALDQTSAELGIEMISPHRSNLRPDTVTQDGQTMRRC